MGLDLRFIPTKYLQERLVDKDNGYSLAGGKVWFYKDQARTELKTMYMKSGSPPDYEYIELPNPLILSSVGTFEYDGNDIIPYFFPYEGIPDDMSTAIELYHIKVFNCDDILQFTRDGDPNVGATTEDAEEIKNYVPDGQFLLHTDIPPTDTTSANIITKDITDICAGGWTYERSAGSTAVDKVIFERFGSAIENPTGNPRYACRITSEFVDLGDVFKALRLRFRDVNKFTSPPDIPFTYSFSAKTNIGTTFDLNLNLIKNYGSGGDPEEIIPLDPIEVTATYATYNVAVDFGDNDGKIIGSNDDDYLQLEISYPADSLFDISVTDVVLLTGNVVVASFPITTTADQVSQGIAGSLPVPNPDGSDLYLPIKFTPSGFEYDDTVIGSTMDWTCDPLIIGYPIGYLLADARRLETNAYSSDGIPYSRLQAKYWNPDTYLCIYGNSWEFINVTFDGTPPVEKILLTSNQIGVVTTPTDGTPATGFTFEVVVVGDSFTKAQFRITTVAASTPIPEGSYFDFYSPALYWPTVITEKKYMCWYSYTDIFLPPTGTGLYEKKIKVFIESSDTDEDIAQKTLIAMNMAYFALPEFRGTFSRAWDELRGEDPDSQGNLITVTTDTAGTGYVVGDFILVDGGAGLTAVVRVDTLIGDGVDDATVVHKGVGYTGTTYSTTALTGSGVGYIADATAGGTREDRQDGVTGDYVGTRQADANRSHNHTVNANCSVGNQDDPCDHYPGDDIAGNPWAEDYSGLMATDMLNDEGENDARPTNIYVAKLIKY